MFFCGKHVGEDLTTCLINFINFYLLREKSGEEREKGKCSGVSFGLAKQASELLVYILSLSSFVLVSQYHFGI